MAKKTIITGAMIVAAGAANTADKLSASTIENNTVAPRVSMGGLDFDMVRLDDDVLRLGGLGDHGQAFTSRGEDYAEKISNDTLFGGASGAVVGELHRVINPQNNRQFNVLYNPKNRTYYNPGSGKKIDPPAWLRKEVER